MAHTVAFKLLILLVGLSGCAHGVSMLIKKGEEAEIVLFSPLEGTLTFQSEAAASATLSLWIKWKDQKGEYETFRTDQQGKFSIPKKTVH